MSTAAKVKLFHEGVYLMMAPAAVLAVTRGSVARESAVFYPDDGGGLGDRGASQRNANGLVAARDAR